MKFLYTQFLTEDQKDGVEPTVDNFTSFVRSQPAALRNLPKNIEKLEQLLKNRVEYCKILSNNCRIFCGCSKNSTAPSFNMQDIGLKVYHTYPVIEPVLKILIKYKTTGCIPDKVKIIQNLVNACRNEILHKLKTSFSQKCYAHFKNFETFSQEQIEKQADLAQKHNKYGKNKSQHQNQNKKFDKTNTDATFMIDKLMEDSIKNISQRYKPKKDQVKNSEISVEKRMGNFFNNKKMLAQQEKSV